MNEEITPKPQRSKLAWTGWILWFTTVGGLYFIRHEAATKDAEIQQNQKQLLSWIERAYRTMATLDSDKVIASIDRQDKNLTSLQARMQADAGKLEEALKQQQDLNLRMSATLDPGEARAGEALKLADEAKAAGHSELSLVYLANAIRSQPRDVRLLEKYTAWSQEANNPAVMQGTENLLQVALYEVAAKDVPHVVKLLETVAKKQQESAAIGEADASKEASPDDAFAKLKDDPLENFILDQKKIAARIEALSAIIEQIVDGNQDDSKFRDEVNRQLEIAQACGLAHQVSALTNMRFTNLATTEKLMEQTPSEGNRVAALSALQAAEAAVNQIWSVPMTLVPSALLNKLVELPERLKQEAEKIQDAVGKNDVAEARRIWESRRNQEAEFFDWKIIGCQEAIEKNSKILAKVQGPRTREEAESLYKEMSEKIKNLKEQQFAQYQKWATSSITSMHGFFEKSSGIGNDYKATNAFYNSKPNIREVDQKLLSPEVAQYLQAVMAKILAVLPPEKVAELQESLSFSKNITKKKLEDF